MIHVLIMPSQAGFTLTMPYRDEAFSELRSDADGLLARDREGQGQRMGPARPGGETWGLINIDDRHYADLMNAGDAAGDERSSLLARGGQGLTRGYPCRRRAAAAR